MNNSSLYLHHCKEGMPLPFLAHRHVENKYKGKNIQKKKMASQNCSAGSKKKKLFCRILHTGRSKEKKGSFINILQNCARYRDPIEEEIKTFSRYHLFPIVQCCHSPIIRQVASERGGWQGHVFSAFFAGARPYISRGWHTGRAGTL